MPSTFWSNTIWFILLGVFTIIQLIFIFMKVKCWKRVFAVYITISGMTYAFELTITSGMHAYEYFPKIIPHNLYNDSIAGNYFSQFSVTATALLIAVYNMKYYWQFVFAGTYGIIEELFLRLGIYKHFWYRTWMTVLGLFLLFWITKKIYKSSLKHLGNIEKYVYIFFGLFTLHLTTMWFFRVLKIHTFGRNLDIAQSKHFITFVISTVYMIVLGNSIMAIYFLKINWLWRATIILLLYAAHYLTFKLGLMYYKAGWFLSFTTIAIFSMYLFIFILDKLYGQTDSNHIA